MPARPLLIAVEGISGSGKSTLVARAAPLFGWVALAEAYDRLDPRPRIDVTAPAALARVERILLDEEGRRWQAARALVAEGRTVIADTGFLGPITYSAGLVEMGAAPASLKRDVVTRARALARSGRWGLPDLTIWLATEETERRRRAIADPVRHPPQLADRHERVGRFESRFFAEGLPTVVPRRVRRLSGDRPVAAVVAGLRRTARAARPLRAGEGPALRVLDLLARFPVEGRPP
ncbi:MAG: hypothetical protein WBG19_10490 [Thermoplasmata archaeon]